MGFPIFRFLFRKMWNNRWLTLSSLAGLIVAVAFTTSIPMYADGSLKRVVSSSLEEKNQGYPAGAVLMRYQAVGSSQPDMQNVEQVNDYIQNEIPQLIGFPYHNYVRNYAIRSTVVSPVDTEKVDPSKRRQMSVVAKSGLGENVELLQGKMYADQVENGVIEAVVLEDSLYRNYFRVGDEFLYPTRGGGGSLKIRVVGAFAPTAGEHRNDVYWYQGLEGTVNNFFISEQVMEEELLQQRGVPLDLANWYYNFDLSDIQTSDLSPVAQKLERIEIDVYQALKDTRVDISFLDMLEDFKKQSLQLQTLLFTLAIPMIAMVFYYITMNSRQTLERQRSDIAVLRSRGASNRQIFTIFLLEGLLLGGLALFVGPLLGWFMAKSIGASNGFLTFVDRASIPVDVNIGTLLYGLSAVVIALAASLIPAVMFARSTIVGLKKQMARADRHPFWMRWYLDIVLIGLCAYGWYLFQQRQFISLQTGMGADQLQVQPLLFFVPALSIFALGLFFLRIFPWMLKLMNWLGKRFLPVPIYLTLTQLSRSSKAYYPLMLLLILTLGLGVYNASAARTIDLNSEEQVKYQYGADVTLQTVWEGFVEVEPSAPPDSGGENGGEGGDGGNGGSGGGGGQQPPQNEPPPQIFYREPPFQVFNELDGVEHATRVLTTRGNATVSGRTAGQGTVMGIDNVDFAKVAWLERTDLFPLAHPNAYLDRLGDFEQAVIIPDNFAEKHQLEPGDMMSIAIEQTAMEFVIVATVPYWPTQYPGERPFFIVNLDYIYDNIPMVPYDVWVKMEDGARLTPMMEQLQEEGIQLAALPQDARSELVRQSRHPSRGGVFGILSLGFLVSVLISLIGYILYWFFNLSSRVVQFGVLRAMGLSRPQLSGMLLLEQGFTAGLSILLGIVIGRLTSYLFLPFLQTSGSAQLQVPPFRIIFDQKDTISLYIVVGVMMLIGASLLFMHIRRLKVHQAVKLGEER